MSLASPNKASTVAVALSPPSASVSDAVRSGSLSSSLSNIALSRCFFRTTAESSLLTEALLLLTGLPDLLRAEAGLPLRDLDLLLADPAGDCDLIRNEAGDPDLLLADPAGEADLLRCDPTGEPDRLLASDPAGERDLLLADPDLLLLDPAGDPDLLLADPAGDTDLLLGDAGGDLAADPDLLLLDPAGV